MTASSRAPSPHSGNTISTNAVCPYDRAATVDKIVKLAFQK
jgi:hypothetical protein